MTPFRQTSFACGELSPQLYGRQELHQYHEGLRTLRNFMVTPRGSAINRPGTVYIATAKNTGDTNPIRLIPFVLDDGDTYVLEVGHQYIRFYKNAQQIQSAGNPYELNSGNIPGGTVLYNGADLQQLKFAQVGSIIYLLLGTGNGGPGYQPQTLTYVSDTNWTLGQLIFDVPQPAYLGLFGGGAWVQGPVAIGPTANVASEGGVITNGGGGVPPSTPAQEWQWAITEIGQFPSGAKFESAPFVITEMETFAKSGATPWSDTITYAANALVYVNFSGTYYTSIAGGNTGNYPPHSPGQWTATGSSTPPTTQTTVPVPMFLETTEQINAPLYDGTLGGPSGNGTYNKGQFVSLDGTGKWWVATQNVLAKKSPLVYSDPNNGLTQYWDGPHGPVYISWAPFSNLTQAGWNPLGWKVYRGQHGVFGLLGEVGVVAGVIQPYFKDYGADPDYSQPPPQGRNPFKVFGFNGSLLRTENPSVVGFFQGRMVLSNTQQRPFWMWGSQVDNPTIFDSHIPGVDSDEYEFELNSTRYEQIRSIAAMGDQLFFPSAGGLWVASGSGTGPMTRSNIQADKHSDLGASWNDPILLGDVALYVKRLGLGVLEVIFDWRVAKWRANDVTALSRHLFEGTSFTQVNGGFPAQSNRGIFDWFYAHEPYRQVWASRNDGALLSLCYQTQQTPQNEQPLPDVKAWAWHDTGPQTNSYGTLENGAQRLTRDFFESVCAVHEDNPPGTVGYSQPEDAIYVVVRRYIGNSSPVRYIERFATRQTEPTPPSGFGINPLPEVFLDAAKVFNGANGTVFTLAHLANETVMVWADGNALGPFVASNTGVVDFTSQWPNSGLDTTLPKTVVIGLQYYSDLQTLDLRSAQVEIGGKRKNVAAIMLDVVNSRGTLVGPNFTMLEELDQRQVSDQFGPVALMTDHFQGYISGVDGFGGRVSVRQTDPLPIEITGVLREVEIGGEL